MSRRALILVAPALLIGGAALLSAQDHGVPRDPTADTRLKLAREGFEFVQQRYTHTLAGDVLNEFPTWSLRIMEAQRDASGDAVGAVREHLVRMKDYARITEARHRAGQGLQSAAIDGRFRVAEAESLLWKVQAK